MPDQVTDGSPRRLIDLVDRDQIQGLLLERASRMLSDEKLQPQLDAVTRGIVSEVAYVVGDPPPPDKAERAAWCVALGVAASLEASALPNQQLGGESRAEVLRTKYLAVKAELAGSGSTAGGGGRVPAPLFAFPAAPPPPDQTRWDRRCW